MSDIKLEVTLDLIEEMAECIHNCSWVSGEEMAAYMKSCITGGNYDPEQWSVDGKGQVALDRDLTKISIEYLEVRNDNDCV